jgi:hypothetical protein
MSVGTGEQEMDNHSFWQKWLFAVGMLLIIFGIAMALFNQTQLFDFLFNMRVNFIFWPDAVVALDITRFQQWIYGVLGATISGWGVCMAFLAYYPFRNKERWAWNAIALGSTVWFVMDTGLSLYFHVIFNAIFNTLLFIAVWLPLAFTLGGFKSLREGRSK